MLLVENFLAIMGFIGLLWLLNEYFGVFVALIVLCAAGAGLFYLYETLGAPPVWVQNWIVGTLMAVFVAWAVYDVVAKALKRLRPRKR
jgi:hypothetical protein